MRRKLAGRAGARGFSLLELMVAVVVLAIAVVALMRSADQSRRGIGQAAARAVAQLVAQDRAEEVKLTGASGADRLPQAVTMGGIDWRVATTGRETASGLVEMTIRVSAPDQPGAVLVAYVGPEGVR